MPKIILHRAQYKGFNESIANNPKHIKSIIKDYDVEIDLWRQDKQLYLGHDYPKYKIDLDFLIEYRKRLFIHAKDIETLFFLSETCYDLHYFYHDIEKAVLTSKKFIWQQGYNDLTSKTILVDISNNPKYHAKCYGLCVDFLPNKKY